MEEFTFVVGVNGPFTRNTSNNSSLQQQRSAPQRLGNNDAQEDAREDGKRRCDVIG